MFIDYKFWYIKRDDDGFIIEVAVKFFRGDITTELENGQNVTRYRRNLRFNKSILDNFNLQVVFDSANNPALLLTSGQFGQIKTDEELRSFCNQKLAQLGQRLGINPVREQS